MIKNISVVIIAHNASKTLSKTLSSLDIFQEIIVYENNSTDDTPNIAKTFKNVVLVEGDFLGFGLTKNKAASYASNSWILSLDSDEVLTQDLIDELKSLRLEDDHDVFMIKRDNYFLDKLVRFSGWGDDFLVRLYNKNRYSFSEDSVHEYVKIDKNANIKRLKNSFKHYAITDINQFLQKIAKYSDLASQNKTTCSFILVVLKAHYAFVKTYIFQLGFLDGWRGFFIAVLNFVGKFYRYTKRYINCKGY